MIISFQNEPVIALVTETTSPAPTQNQIRQMCQAIQKSWDERERELRAIRAAMACKYGVCRNN